MTEIEVRQVQSDSTAGLFYSKGVSIVHLSMIIGILNVSRPNLTFGEQYRDAGIENAERHADECNMQAGRINFTMNVCVISHFYCMIVTFFSEIFETDITNFGTIIRICDVLAVLMNMSTALLSMANFFGWYSMIYLDIDGFRPLCFDHQPQQEYLGSSVSWLAIELIVWFSFIFTMIICLIK